MTTAFQAWLARLDLAADRALLESLARLLFRQSSTQSGQNPQKIKHIVLYRVGNIGDIVVALSAIKRLRLAFPNATLTLLTSSGRADLPGADAVLAGWPIVDRIIQYLPPDLKTPVGFSRMKRQVLEAGPVDLFVNLPVTLQNFRRSLQDLFLAKALGSRSAIGFTLLLPEIFRPAYARRYPQAILKTSDWLSGIVTAAMPDTAEACPPSSDSKASIASGSSVPAFGKRDELNRLFPHFDITQPILAVNAGAKLAIKRWPLESFQAALQQVTEKMPNIQVLLLGSAAEAEMNTRIAEGLLAQPSGASPIVCNLSGKLSLTKAWELLQHADVVLSNDTGTMHMAGVLNKLVIVPMSGQWPTPLWHPPGESLTALREPVSCAPCFQDTCPLAEQICLTRIAPEAIAQTILHTLSASSDANVTTRQ